MKEISIDVPVEPPAELKPLFIPIPPEYVEDAYKKDEYLVLVGPQHPGSGHMRIIVRVDGDVIVDAIPDPGYVHRSMEKLAENRLYIQNIPLFERPAIMDNANFNLGYIRAIEEALDIEVPERAKYLRMIMAELCRIGTHLYDAAILAVFIGHTTGFMYPFAIRELICECLVKMTGVRFTSSFIIPGGIRRDADNSVLDFVKKATFEIERRLKNFEKIFIKNPATIARLKDVGVLSKEEAIKYGVVGPFLRASGVEYDVRKVEGYEAYDELDWEIVVADEGDGYSRFLVRVNEINQSLNIIRQAIGRIPEGDVISQDLFENVNANTKNPKDIRGAFYDLFANLKLPLGETTTLTEAARGLLLYTIISDGESNVPYRVRIVSPGWLYLRGFMESLRGERLADLQAIYGSFGYFPPEADR
ncbi:NADH-quinone oxidoreductase subunit D [Archaeoglobales archaeon]|nr:MAG: NADH-quinone oxidoreductase subunit D [Archaeoglobales archaeon]